MTLKTVGAWLCHKARSFRRARGGNVAVIFGFACIPIIGLVGVAIDYSRANSVKADLQSALDAAALMLSKEVETKNETQLKDAAGKYITALFTHHKVGTPSVELVYDKNASSLTLKGAVDVATEFPFVYDLVRDFGKFDQIRVSSSSTVKWGSTRVRLALALDTTGSMSDSNKIATLKTATKSLLDQLQTSSSNGGDVNVSIIPFSKNVNLGSNNYNASWIDWTEWEDEPPVLKTSKPLNWNDVEAGSDCPFTVVTHGFDCVNGPGSTTSTKKIPTAGPNAGYICPGIDYGVKIPTKVGVMYNGCYNSVNTTKTVSSCSGLSNCSCTSSKKKSGSVCTQTSITHTWIKNARSTWNGCVADRGSSKGPSNDGTSGAGKDYDQTVSAPTSNADSKFPAEQNMYCSAPVMSLSSDWLAMKKLVNDLHPAGATNQPIGLVWAWQSLVGGGPLTVPAKDPKYKYQDVIVLMSDGLNTQNRWNGNSGASSDPDVDKRMYDSSGLGTCANIKAAGITIYTVHFNTDANPTSTLLKNCASDSKKFFAATSSNAFVEAFKKIGSDLSQLRLAE